MFGSSWRQIGCSGSKGIGLKGDEKTGGSREGLFLMFGILFTHYCFGLVLGIWMFGTSVFFGLGSVLAEHEYMNIPTILLRATYRLSPMILIIREAHCLCVSFLIHLRFFTHLSLHIGNTMSVAKSEYGA